MLINFLNCRHLSELSVKEDGPKAGATDIGLIKGKSLRNEYKMFQFEHRLLDQSR